MKPKIDSKKMSAADAAAKAKGPVAQYKAKMQRIGSPSSQTRKGSDLPGKARTKGTPAMQARGRVGNKYPKGTKWGDDTRRGA